jgi:hypothetical protein
MICETCHGKGLVNAGGQNQPCAECGGLGVIHCCEGLQAQPEQNEPAGRVPAGPDLLEKEAESDR